MINTKIDEICQKYFTILYCFNGIYHDHTFRLYEIIAHKTIIMNKV